MQISEDLVQYITAEIIRRLGIALPQAKPALRLVGSRHDLSAPALAALQEHFEVTEQPGWDHSVPADTAVLITPPLLARYARQGGLKMTPAEAPSAALPRCRADGAGQAAPKRPARQIITESDIMKMCPQSKGEGQELRLAPGTVITPLAKDYILAMQINLI